MIRIAFKTTGCKVNQADEESVRRALADLPVEWVSPDQPADVIVVNACAVTQAAERDGRSWVNRGTRAGSSVVLAGCMATRVTRDGGDARLPGDVRVVPGTRDRDLLVQALRDEVARREAAGGSMASVPVDAAAGGSMDPEARVPGDARSSSPHTRTPSRARPLVKVQDGCDCRCAYCIVPLLRGPSRSVPVEAIQPAVLAAARASAAEVVLAGVDLAAWGRDLHGASLPDLVARLRALRTGLRFRLSSIEPHGLTDRLLEAMAAGTDVCPHLHVPLQSGCDRVLRAMHRPYATAMLADRVNAFARALPGLSIGMDVIVGFPGETDADFQETRAFLESLPVTYLHVFPYSVRPGTEAASLPGEPDPPVKAARSQVLRDFSAARRAAHAMALVGRDVEVVDVRARAGGHVESLSGDYTRVLRRDASGPRPGRFLLRVASARGADVVASAAPSLTEPA